MKKIIEAKAGVCAGALKRKGHIDYLEEESLDQRAERGQRHCLACRGFAQQIGVYGVSPSGCGMVEPVIPAIAMI